MYEANLRSLNEKKVLPIKSLYRPTSFAYDWITQNIYYVDERAKVINVYSYTTGHFQQYFSYIMATSFGGGRVPGENH
jgi:hypothetical protein